MQESNQTGKNPFRLIIAGSRTVKAEHARAALKAYPFLKDVTVVVCGEAKGADTFGKLWAEHNKITVDSRPADWETHGKRAGYLRNVDMAENADALLAIWNGRSSGTRHMIEIAAEKGLKVFVYCYEEKPKQEPATETKKED